MIVGIIFVAIFVALTVYVVGTPGTHVPEYAPSNDNA